MTATVRDRPMYNKGFKALEEAHAACFKHPDRGVLGMSHGPFSGVNEALGIIASLEEENIFLKQKLSAHGNGISKG